MEDLQNLITSVKNQASIQINATYELKNKIAKFEYHVQEYEIKIEQLKKEIRYKDTKIIE